MYIKIQNLIFKKDNINIYDYKGIDLSKIVIGSQIYGNDNTCVLQVPDDTEINHPDILVITEDEYYQYKTNISKSEPELQLQPPSIEDRIKAVEDTLLSML